MNFEKKKKLSDTGGTWGGNNSALKKIFNYFYLNLIPFFLPCTFKEGLVYL